MRVGAGGILLLLTFSLGLLPGGPSPLRVGGSTTFLPLAQKLTPMPDTMGGGSLMGVSLAARGVIDVGLSDVYIVPPKGMIAVPVATAELSPIVSRGVALHRITISHLIALFHGAIRNWRSLTGQNLPVVLVLRGPSSGSNLALRRTLGRPAASALQATSAGQVLATVRGTPGAVGFIERGMVDTSQVHRVRITGTTAISRLQLTCWAYFYPRNQRAWQVAGQLRRMSL